MPDTVGQLQPLSAEDAESFAEEFVASALAGGSVGEDAHDEVSDDEEGGPFIELDDAAQLPPEPGERPERDAGTDEPQISAEPNNNHGPSSPRGARWAARGR